MRKDLFAATLLALVIAGNCASQVSSARIHVPAPLADAKTRSRDRLIFDAKRSTEFLQDLQSFLASVPGHGADIPQPYAQLVETFNEAASNEGVAATPSGNLVDLAYDWIDRSQWKYFVRLEVNVDTFEKLLESSNRDPVYREVTLACLIYGGQGIRDFKQYVPEYIDLEHDQEEFRAIKFEPGNRRLALSAQRLAARQVSLYLSRYRIALGYLHGRGIDSAALLRAAEAEKRSEVKSILLHFAELLQLDPSDDLALRTTILLSDVERESPELVTAILRTLEKNKQAVFDSKTNAFDADRTGFRFLLEELDQSAAQSGY